MPAMPCRAVSASYEGRAVDLVNLPECLLPPSTGERQSCAKKQETPRKAQPAVSLPEPMNPIESIDAITTPEVAITIPAIVRNPSCSPK